jgi:hypothetical protein
MRWSKEDYMVRYPQYNRPCAVCGEVFNALHLGSRRRVTCSKPCSAAYTKQVQRANTRAYVKNEKYKSYKAQYYEAVKARRRLAKISDVLSLGSVRDGAPA